MKAALRTHYGPPDVLSVSEIDCPTPRKDELLVKVHASTVSRTDCGVLLGRPYILRFFAGFPRPRFTSTGTDFAGVVASVGSEVTNFKVGDRVFGFNDEGIGSHREFMTLRSNQAINLIPENINFAEAAASIEGFHYAYNFISKVNLRPNSQVLVNGATGAIGSAAIQLLKNYPVKLTAVCGTPHLEKIKSLGAERVIDYLNEDFTKTKDRYDFIFDAVGKSSFSRCRHMLNDQGVYISSELGDRSENIFWALFTPLRKGQKVIFPIPVKIKRSLDLMTEMLAKGQFKPLIDRYYNLEQIAEAFVYADSGQKIGNVVLKIA